MYADTGKKTLGPAVRARTGGWYGASLASVTGENPRSAAPTVRARSGGGVS